MRGAGRLHLFVVLLLVLGDGALACGLVREELVAVADGGDGRRVLVEEVDLLEGESLGL